MERAGARGVTGRGVSGHGVSVLAPRRLAVARPPAVLLLKRVPSGSC
jgi:hypothetical protein